MSAHEDTRAKPTGTEVTCRSCHGRGWKYFDTGKRRSHDLVRGDCRTCNGTGRVQIGSREVWTVFLSIADAGPTFLDINPELYTPVTVASLDWVKAQHRAWIASSGDAAFDEWLDARAAAIPRPNVRRGERGEGANG